MVIRKSTPAIGIPARNTAWRTAVTGSPKLLPILTLAKTTIIPPSQGNNDKAPNAITNFYNDLKSHFNFYIRYINYII